MISVALIVIALIALMKRRQARRRLESSLSTHGLTLEAPLLQYTCRPSLTCGAEPYTSSPHHISISVLPAAKLHGTFPVSRLASSQVYRVLTSFAFRSFQVFNPKHVQHAWAPPYEFRVSAHWQIMESYGSIPIKARSWSLIVFCFRLVS